MALTLSKTGITNGSTVEAWHVTQSIDAFTGAKAYDITISGSLTLTGSVSSLNGFTGSLSGTASNANVSQKVEGQYVTNASPPTPALNGNLKFVGGAATISAKNISIDIPALNGKTLGVDCFIGLAYSSSVSSSEMLISIDSLAGSNLSFAYDKSNPSGGNPTTPVEFFYTIIYTV